MNILLLRGLARQVKHWGKFPKELYEATQMNVTCIDLPGVGVFSEHKSPSTVELITEHVRKEWLKQKQNHTQRWAIVAHSLGGMIALDWSSRYPNDFEKTFLINTSSKLSLPWERLNYKSLPILLKILVNKNSPSRESYIWKLICNTPPNQQIIKEWQRLEKENPIKINTLKNQLIAASRFFPKNISNDKRLLFLLSEKDYMVNAKCTYQLHNFYKNSQLETHPSAGHDLACDDPQWLIDKLKKNLDINPA